MLSALSNLSTGGISHHLPCLAFSLICLSFPENSYQLRSHRQKGAGKIYLACDSPSAWPEMGTQLHSPAETRPASALFSPPADTQGSLSLFSDRSAAKWACTLGVIVVQTFALTTLPAGSISPASLHSFGFLGWYFSTALWCDSYLCKPIWRQVGRPFTHRCVARRVHLETQAVLVMGA